LPELVVRISDPVSAAAAVQSGADAVTVRFSGNGYRKADGSMSREDIYKISDYCRERGKKAYLEYEGVCFGGGDLSSALRLGLWAQHIGICALRTSDLGLLRALRQELPEMPVHLTGESGIHSLRGVRFASDIGAARICLPAQLPKERIAYIAASSPAETEMTILSPLCAAFAGECSALRLTGDARREMCSKLCGSSFSMGRKHALHPFSMHGFSLAARLDDIKKCAPDALFIDGVGDSPERTAAALSILSRVMRGGKPPVSTELGILGSAILSPSVSDAFFDARPDMAVSGAAEQKEDFPSSQPARLWLSEETPTVALDYAVYLRAGERFRLAARDDQGNVASADGPVPFRASGEGLTKIQLQTQLFRARSTPYTVRSLNCVMDAGLYVPREAIEAMQQTIFSVLSSKRRVVPFRIQGKFVPAPFSTGRSDAPVTTVSVTRASQLSPALASLSPALVSVPVFEASDNTGALEPFLKNGSCIVAASLPRVIWDGEESRFRAALSKLFDMGVKDVFVADPSQIKLVTALGMRPRGGIELNIFNSETMDIYAGAGLLSAVLPAEASFQSIRALSKPIDTEIVIYGRLPLMLTETCIIKNTFGVCSCDRFPELRFSNGEAAPVLRAHECRNIVYSPEKLFLPDRKRTWSSLGVWGARLCFTTENARECAAVLQRYLGVGEYAPNNTCSGFYYNVTI